MQAAPHLPPAVIGVCPTTRGAMLIDMTDRLDQAGITYFLHFGTLLGAHRGGAIIPWTADVDIGVPDLHTDPLVCARHALWHTCCRLAPPSPRAAPSLPAIAHCAARPVTFRLEFGA